jgi:hypothetical protein
LDTTNLAIKMKRSLQVNRTDKFICSHYIQLIKSFLFIIIIPYIASCGNPNNKPGIESGITTDSIDSSQVIDTNIVHEKDTISSTSKITHVKSPKKKAKIYKKAPTPPIRYSEFPGDQNFNGAPLTQQETISKENLEKFPDTLNRLALERYKSYDPYYPKSIADNFEKGISIERIHYPAKLIFRFMVFENEWTETPYMVKEVTVRRTPDGTMYTE